ncbi:MAG: DUF4442 domain-containing protein [Bdellovibrionaceae bacterium]|nr:DUF4442 domain-containing protein [Pseudobdellovibrionaceae bacterium]
MSLRKLDFYIKATSLFRVPLLFFCCPKVLALDDKAKVKLPLNWITKNHYRSMYFGALSMGAELAVALPILNEMFVNKRKVNFIFKDFKAEFHKRAETDVIFECPNVKELLELISKSETQKQRITQAFNGKAYSATDPENIFMSYEISISVKPL